MITDDHPRSIRGRTFLLPVQTMVVAAFLAHLPGSINSIKTTFSLVLCFVILFSDAPNYLDYFVDYQVFYRFHVRHFEPFVIGSHQYLAAIVDSKTPKQCMPSLILRWSSSVKKLMVYQFLGTSGGSKFKFFTVNETYYLLLLNKEGGCLTPGNTISTVPVEMFFFS